MTNDEKRGAVAAYAREHGITKIVAFAPPRFRVDFDGAEHVTWDEIIMYRFFYRLLQEIDGSTLLVINECLRSQERSLLHYNCLRNYLRKTQHQLIFQALPVIASPDDFMILVDLDTRDRWRRAKLADVDPSDLRVTVAGKAPVWGRVDVETSPKTRATYAAQKRALIDGIGLRDPHTIPRTLHLLAGAEKGEVARGIGGQWVGRNARIKRIGLVAYSDAGPEHRSVFEFCHSYQELADWVSVARPIVVPAMVSDLRVDGWYFKRAVEWSRMVDDACSAIRDRLRS